jgi:hypothetical protein
MVFLALNSHAISDDPAYTEANRESCILAANLPGWHGFGVTIKL